jgi:uncharacterized protein (TIGR02453 family)
MPTQSSFSGFSPDGLRFLEGLAANNNKAWFDAHRAAYDESLIEPAKAFVEAIGPRLRRFAPNVQSEPRVNGSIMRINRDVRFSKDKSPYKTTFDMWFWEGQDRGWDIPGFFFRLEPKRLILGAGQHHLDKEKLDRFREAVVNDKTGRALVKALDRVRESGPYSVYGAERKTVPRGFDAAHPRASLLLHEGLFASFEAPPPHELATPKFVEFCAGHFRAMAPFNAWLRSVLG